MSNIVRSAKSAATKRNNQARKSMPLFTDGILSDLGLLTTPDEQLARLEKSHEISDRYIAEMKKQEGFKSEQSRYLYAWSEKVLPEWLYNKCVARIKACPAGYEWDILCNAIADHTDLPRRDVWKALTNFCGLG